MVMSHRFLGAFAPSTVYLSQPRPRGVEKTVAILMVFVATGALIPVLQVNLAPGTLPSSTGGNRLNMAVWLVLFLISAVFLAPYRAHVLRVILMQKWLLAIVGLAIVSVAWSDVPTVTFRRSIAFAGTSLIGLYLGIRFTSEELLDVLAKGLALALVLSILASLTSPIARHEEAAIAGAWRGIYLQKNLLAQVMVLGALTFFLKVTVTNGSRRILWITLLVLAYMVIYLANSKTALIIALVMPFVTALYLSIQRHLLVTTFAHTAAVVSVVIIAAIAYSNFEEAPILERGSEILDRDVSTLTGRTDIWNATWETVLERPWLGWGYRSFWLAGIGIGSGEVMREIGWNPIAAHNGILEVLLDLGFVGLTLLAYGLAVVSKRALILLRQVNEPIAAWPLLCITFLLLANMTESGLMEQDYYHWILLVAVSSRTVMDLPHCSRESPQMG